MKTKSLEKMSQMFFGIVVAGVTAIGMNGCASTKISESTGQYVDDSAITTKVKARLLEDPVVSGLGISVETYKGVIQLSGFANSMAEKNQAEQIAEQTEGVRTVKNNIQLK
jgi:hyperosmotically inducible periplasmic protein